MDEHTRVCIVGKSSSLSGKNLGSVIDSHDLITRINFKNSHDHDWSLYTQDIGERTHHIVAHPKVVRHYVNNAVDDLIKNLKSIEDSEYGKKIFIITYSKEFWDVDGDYPPRPYRLPKDRPNVFTKKEKDRCIRDLWGVCWDLGVVIEKCYYSEMTRNIHDMMVYFYDKPLGYPHGLFTGTATVLDYTKKYKNINIAGLGNELTYSHDKINFRKDKNRYYGKTRPLAANIRLEYDQFFIRQAIKSGRINRLDDESYNTI